MRQNVICLLGKLPMPGTIFAQVRDQLEAQKIAVQIHLPHDTGALDTNAWPKDALLVHRGLNTASLEQLTIYETQGWQCCNSPAASLLVQDRHQLMTCLRNAGLPVPDWWQLKDWADVSQRAEKQSVVIKAADGTVGRGSQVIIITAGDAPEHAPFEGPYLVEDHIENDGQDRKLYVAGSNCFGLLKPWPRDVKSTSTPFDVPANLRDFALATGAAAGLEVFGVDVVLGAEGPKIVDVNVFPSFNGIDNGPKAVVGHILARLS